MKKVLSSILISFVIFANLLAPISVGVGKNGVEIKKNEANAEYTYSLNVTPTLGDKYIKLDVEIAEGSSTGDSAQFTITSSDANLRIKATLLKDGKETGFDDSKQLAIQDKKVILTLGNSLLSKLTPGTPYQTKIELIESLETVSFAGTPGYGGKTTKTLYETTIDTPTVAEGKQEVVANAVEISGESKTITPPKPSVSDMPACSIVGGNGTFSGCIAQAFYYVFFIPTSYLFALSGVFFDSTFAYSVQDTSYRSTFVVEGWGLVRDFCNMFFIFILLYVAISTTLGLHGAKTKETIINIVIIGLFINFSLFATQLIIDASNITARVFYNADSIKITENGANGVANATPTLKVGEGGVIPLSAALVNKVNPQNLILRSKEINNIPDRGGMDAIKDKDYTPNLNAGSFILIVIIASAVNIVGFIVFLSVGMIFIARVIGLWIAMIMAPLAFFTYIIPELAGTKMVGWKNWWPETLKLAFLAPIFIFFMYIILKFLELDLISDSANRNIVDVQSGLGFFVATLIPFAFIMILMMKAKGIAKDMSGELGEMATKAGSTLGGMVLGGAVGVGAMAMRGTVGKLGDKLDKSTWVNNLAGGNSKFGKFVGNRLKDTGQFVGKGSFDVRSTKAGAMAGSGMGVDMGKGKEGGYVKDRKDKVERKQKRAKEIEVNEDEELTQNINRLEMDLQSLLNKNAHELEALDKRITAARQDAADINSKDTSDPVLVASKKAALLAATAMVTITPADIARKTAAIAAANAMDVDDIVKIQAKKDANDKVTELKENKKAIKSGGTYIETALTAAPGTTARGVVGYAGNRINGRTIDDLEIKEIPDAHAKKQKESRRRTTNYANNTAFWGGDANREAQHKIIMETKIDSGGGSSH